MAKKPESSAVRWLTEPEAQDYPGAASYLALIADATLVAGIMKSFNDATPGSFKAKDILRAARLPLLPTDNPHVKSDLAKIAAGKPLSPVLLVRGDIGRGVPAQIADGYHRVCASYYTNENTAIPVRIVEIHEKA